MQNKRKKTGGAGVGEGKEEKAQGKGRGLVQLPDFHFGRLRTRTLQVGKQAPPSLHSPKVASNMRPWTGTRHGWAFALSEGEREGAEGESRGSRGRKKRQARLSEFSTSGGCESTFGEIIYIYIYVFLQTTP
jgi:hypothetical protein